MTPMQVTGPADLSEAQRSRAAALKVARDVLNGTKGLFVSDAPSLPDLLQVAGWVLSGDDIYEPDLPTVEALADAADRQEDFPGLITLTVKTLSPESFFLIRTSDTGIVFKGSQDGHWKVHSPIGDGDAEYLHNRIEQARSADPVVVDEEGQEREG